MLDFKMFKPPVFAWIEKTYESIFVSFQHCSYVRTLIEIARLLPSTIAQYVQTGNIFLTLVLLPW